MTYDDIAAAFLIPSGDAIAAPHLPTSPARRVRDAVEPIATIGWWSRAAGDGFGRLGLDFFGGYLWGRTAALGADVAPSVAVAAFGVFEPTFMEAVLGSARAMASHDGVLAAREAGATAGLTEAASGISPEFAGDIALRLRSALDRVDGAARPLFSALRSLPTPADPFGALWRAAEMYREHRGDGHLAACVAAGLDAVEMNVLTELWLGYRPGEYSATRGFAPERIESACSTLEERGWVEGDAITPEGRAARDEVEAATDASQTAVIAALGDDVDALIDDLSQVASAVLAAHAAPADPRKRAAG